MHYPSQITAALIQSKFAEAYYHLCIDHPMRKYEPCASPQKAVIATLADIGAVTKLKDPGRVFSVSSLSTSQFRLIFVIHYRTSVELMISWQIDEESFSGDNFCSIAFQTTLAEGKQPPVPPYPRPNFYSLTELKQIVSAALSITASVSKVYDSNIAKNPKLELGN